MSIVASRTSVQTLIALALIGFAAQLVDGALGMAYGATSSTLVLSAGFSPVVASASVHLAELGTTLASGASHWRFGNVDWRTVRRIGIPGAFGAFAGAALVGGFIVLMNARTIFGVTGETTTLRGWTYAAIVAVWIAGLAVVVRAHRRDGSPLLEPA
ncbi:MAG: sulfite exporter TauE/SafE family protein [Gaiellaceae bacterium]